MMHDIPTLQSLTTVLGIADEYPQLLQQAWKEISQTSTCIQVGQSELWHYPDKWDSENFGRPVGKVTTVAGTNNTEIAQALEQLLQLKLYTYLVFRIDQLQTSWVQQIEMHDGILVDGSIDLFYATGQAKVKDPNPDITIVPFTEQHRKPVLECAQAFRYGRFFSDPEFSIGSKVYTAWTENAINGTAADQVLVALISSVVVGFIAVQKKSVGSKEYLYIPLIAKHPNCTTRGVGKELLKTVITLAAAQRMTGVALGTQTSNIAALRSYTQMGFYPYASEFTLRIL